MAVFEWIVEPHAASPRRAWEWNGAPVSFKSGGDILGWSEGIDALRGATRWREG